jgi:hypothetical protein
LEGSAFSSSGGYVEARASRLLLLKALPSKW